jgi:hypothetical protein
MRGHLLREIGWRLNQIGPLNGLAKCIVQVYQCFSQLVAHSGVSPHYKANAHDLLLKLCKEPSNNYVVRRSRRVKKGLFLEIHFFLLRNEPKTD